MIKRCNLEEHSYGISYWAITFSGHLATDANAFGFNEFARH